MKYFCTAVLLAVCVVASLPAAAFDCTDNTIYGKKLEEINDGKFVLYKEAGGISYYNYVGGCFIDNVHDRACPAIAYAFVQGTLYARIISYKRSGPEQKLAELTGFLKVQPEKIKESTDWVEYIWKASGDMIYKLKYNKKTNETRIAKYKRDIREKLSAGLASDPVEKPEMTP